MRVVHAYIPPSFYFESQIFATSRDIFTGNFDLGSAYNYVLIKDTTRLAIQVYDGVLAAPRTLAHTSDVLKEVLPHTTHVIGHAFLVAAHNIRRDGLEAQVAIGMAGVQVVHYPQAPASTLAHAILMQTRAVAFHLA